MRPNLWLNEVHPVKQLICSTQFDSRHFYIRPHGRILAQIKYVLPIPIRSNLRAMGSILFPFALFPSVLLCALGVFSAAPAASDQYKQESLVFERYETTIRMHADGTGERIVHVSMRIQSQGTAQQFGVLGFGYASAFETPHIDLVRVHKPDGTSVDTPTDTAFDMPAEVTRQAPLYSDVKQKQIAVRGLSVGDTLEYEVHTSIDKAEDPGQFWGATHFVPPGTLITLAEVLNLEFPKDKYVQVWSPNHKPTIKETGTMRTYSWEIPQLVAAPKPTGQNDGLAAKGPKDPDEDSNGRKVPSVAWTTFKTWAEVGDWYRSLEITRSEPNDALKARAAEITRDAKGPEEQARAIYAFVSNKVRYVGIDFGIGRYQPHQAAEVLANQYGDCKDKDTLLEALLKAKGFATAPALIGAGIAPTPDVPSPSIFNHVITTVELPGGRVWIDSTPEVAPFGFLSAPIRDQKALVVPANGPASLIATPATAPYPFSQKLDAHGTLDAEGKLTSTISASYRDDDEVIIRGLARNVAPAEWDKVSQYISSATGFGGTTSNTQFKGVDDLQSPVSVTYDYQRHPFGDWDNLRIVPLFPILPFPQLENDTTEPADDINLGAPRDLTAISHIKLPAKYQTDLPDPIHVKTDFATFDKVYRFDGQEITAERTISILKPKVAKADWKTYQKFAKDVSLASESWIQLIAPAKPINIIVEPKPIAAASPKRSEANSKEHTVQIQISSLPRLTPSTDSKSAAPVAPPEGESVQALMERAREQFRSADYAGAKATLEAVKAKNPQQAYVWSLLGGIATMERNYAEARADFQTELKNQPDNSGVALALADVEKRGGDAAAGRKSLADYLSTHSDDLRVALAVSALQRDGHDYEGSLSTLQIAADHHPEDSNVRISLSNTLLDLKRNDEAAAAAKSVLADATDPDVMNNAAYVLSETDRDLPFAESMSRKSVELLEAKSATMTAEEANRQAFASANNLIASWDTLGWILFKEGKLEESLPLVRVAWRDSLRAEVGDHLGQVYEAMNKMDEANEAYRLADAAANSATPEEVRKHIHNSFTRLDAAGVKPGPKNGTEVLQNSRTFKLGHVADVRGWGTFRLELTTTGVIEARQMSGEKGIVGVGDAIKKTNLWGLIPPNSKAHLLRSGVVSCAQTTGCEIVLVPDGGLHTEQE